jgi:hypothetical protein
VRKLLRILLPTLTLCAVSVPERIRASREVTFVKVLDSETPIPGGEGLFGAIHGLNDGSPPLAASDSPIPTSPWTRTETSPSVREAACSRSLTVSFTS